MSFLSITFDSNLFTQYTLLQLILIFLIWFTAKYISQLKFIHIPIKKPIYLKLYKKILKPIFFALIGYLVRICLINVFLHPPLLVMAGIIISIYFVIVNILIALIVHHIQNHQNERMLERVLLAYFIATFVYLVTDLNNGKYLSTIVINFGTNTISLWQVFSAFFAIISNTLIAVIAIIIVDNRIRRINTDANLKQLLRRTSKILLIALAILITLPRIGIDLTVLSVFGGAIGVGVGFGFQKIASNFLSGFIILLDKSIKTGDRIKIDNMSGVVTKITTRYVVLNGSNGAEMLIPNETFISSPVTNHTYSNSDIAIEIIVSVSYKNNLQHTIKIINDCINNIEEINHNKDSGVHIQRFDKLGVAIFMRVWPNKIYNDNLVKNKLSIAIIEEFVKNNIELSYTDDKQSYLFT